jgi:Fe/S biogenesis protein NfuA
MTEPIITISDAARDKVKSLQDDRGFTHHAVRIKVLDLAGRKYTLQFVEQKDKLDDDVTIDMNGVVFYLDAQTLPKARGATLEYIEGPQGSGFRFHNPNPPALAGNPLAARVQKLFDERITPSVAEHGGDVTLIDVSDGKVLLEFGGGCKGCGMVDVTLKEGITKMLKEEIPEITEVLDTTDHSAGTNPYAQSGS